MAKDDIKEAAKAEIRRREWAALRGKATRAYIATHPEIVDEFDNTGDLTVDSFPTHVTKASVLLELHQRARRRESAVSAKQWQEQHPEEAEAMRARIRQELTGDAG